MSGNEALLERRDFLGLVAGGAATILLGRATEGAAADVDDTDRLASWRAVGDAYLHRFPDESDPQRLADALGLASLATLTFRNNRDRRAVALQLDTRIRDDFGNGDTVVLEGWTLARTEARLAALVALATPDP